MQYLWVGLTLLLIRIWAINTQIPVIEAELTWQLIGERMASGFTLYKDIWVGQEPLSAGVYYLLLLITDNFYEFEFWISALILLFQAYLFSSSLNENKAFSEPTLLSAFLYVLLGSLYFDFFTLSPVLLGTTFLLIAFSIICHQAKVMKGEDHFFYIGALIGISSLFYFPFVLFLLFAIVTLGLYSITSLKKHLILLVAFCFPYLIVFIYYFWIDNLEFYFKLGIFSHFNFDQTFVFGFLTTLKILILPFLLLLISVFIILTKGKFIHYQYKLIKIGMHWLVFAAATFLVVDKVNPHSFFVFVPPLVMLSTHMFLIYSKNKLIVDGLFSALFGGMLLILVFGIKSDTNNTPEYFIKRPPMVELYGIKNKSLLVFGEDKNYYFQNSVGGSYLDWNKSKEPFSDLEQYGNVTQIYEVFESNKPEYIIDLEKRLPALSEKIPSIKSNYVRMDSSFVYKRVINN